ncbi:MAG: hypothetical protein CMP22_05745 [Rickettsiales bacterium]|nr:hypothetical protein [Rickettsiales bacterium]
MDNKKKIVLILITLLVLSFTIFIVSKFVDTENPNSETEQVEEVQETESQKEAIQPQPLDIESGDQTSIPNSNSSNLLYVLLIFLTVALFASIYVVIYLLKWRYRISEAQVSIVPQELLKMLEVQIDGFNQYSSYVSEYAKRISHDREKTNLDIQELQKSFVVFQDSLNQKDQEIERYKKGYDSAVYKKFLGKFIKFYIALKKEAEAEAKENNQSLESFSYLLEILEDAFLECNVEIKYPSINASTSDYKDLIGGAKKFISTNQQELHEKIAEVLLPAFILKTQAKEEVLREANVAVYIYEESEVT